MNIIIPLVQTPGDPKDFLGALAQNTSLPQHQFCFAGPKTPGPDVAAFIEGQAGARFVQTPGAEGFFPCLDAAMEALREDALALRFGTWTPPGWADTLVACAEAAGRPATASPMSNDAAPVFAPDFLQDGALPPGVTPAAMMALAQQAAFGENPEIPAPAPSCFYLSHAAFEAVDGFDAESYQEDVAIALDFGLRCGQAGFYHLLCAGLYVHNPNPPGEGDAIPEGEALQKNLPGPFAALEEFLDQRPHRAAEDSLRLHLGLSQVQKTNKPLLLFASHYDFRADAQNHLGGVQLHIGDLVEQLKDDFTILMTARDVEDLRATLYSGECRLSFKLPIGAAPFAPRPSDPGLRAAYTALLGWFPVDAVHIHSTYNASFDLFDLAGDFGLPLVVTLHDYYYICPTIKMLDAEDRVCAAKVGAGCGPCLEQRLGLPGGEATLTRWQQMCGQKLALADVIVAPSRFTGEYYTKVYPFLKDRLRVIGHGSAPLGDLLNEFELPDKQREHWAVATQSEDNFFSSIDVLEIRNGHLLADGWAFCKGQPEDAPIALELRAEGYPSALVKTQRFARPDVAALHGPAAKNSGFTVHIPVHLLGNAPEIFVRPVVRKSPGEAFGAPDDQTHAFTMPAMESGRLNVAFVGDMSPLKGSAVVHRLVTTLPADRFNFLVIGAVAQGDPLREVKQDNFVVTGAYRRSALPAIFKRYNVDVVGILSILMETFCYTLSEAWMMGLPVFTGSLGAQGQRMADIGAGWRLDAGNMAEAAAALLQRLAENPAELEAKKEQAEAVVIDTPKAMAAHYAALYGGFARKGAPWPRAAALWPAYRRAHARNPELEFWRGQIQEIEQVRHEAEQFAMERQQTMNHLSGALAHLQKEYEALLSSPPTKLLAAARDFKKNRKDKP